MTFSRSCLGIDLREDRVVLAHLKRSFGRISLAATKVASLSPDKPKEEREAELINTIQQFVSGQSIPKENVVFALPRERAIVKFVEIPSAAKENLRKVVEYELGRHLPFPPEEAAFDYQVVEEKEGLLRILLVVVRREELERNLDLLKRMGIRPVAVEVGSTATANLFFYDQEPLAKGAIALIEIEKNFLELHFFEKGILKEGFHRPVFDEEERGQELKEALQLGWLKGLAPKDGKQSLFFFGREATETLIEKLRHELSMPITLAQSFGKIQLSDGIKGIPESYPSVGLALRGLSKTKWTINLLPLGLRKKVSRIGIYLAMGLSVLAILLAGAWALIPLVQEREELARVSAQVKEMKPKVEAIEAVQKQRDLLEKEVREFEALKSDDGSKLEVLRELSEILPPSAWIWNLKLRSKEVEINGFATSASDLIAILDKSPLFEKVEFSSPVTKERRLFGDQTEKERFRISAKMERTR